MRLIDADALIKRFSNSKCGETLKTMVSTQPTSYDINKVVEHDSELLDKVGEYLFNSRYASEKIADFDYDQTVTFTKLEWMKIIAELKADVNQ